MGTVSERIRGLADVYGRGAEGYAAILDPTLEPMAHDVVAIGGIVAGHRVLDIASGSGLIARAAARAGARVVAADLSLGTMKVARRSAADPAIAVDLIVADAGSLPIRTNAADVVTCSLSLSHFTDLSSVGLEVRRVLRPGGIFVATTWGSGGCDPSYSAALAAYRDFTHGQPRPFSTILDERTWSDAGRGRDALVSAGFGPTEVTTRTLTGAYPDFTAALDWAFAWPLTAGGIARLPQARRSELRAEALARIEASGELGWRRDVHYFRATPPAVAPET